MGMIDKLFIIKSGIIIPFIFNTPLFVVDSWRQLKRRTNSWKQIM